ncbi:uncharacterized protein GGS22DRAFT_173605 [Annulohypoxylon maeteangense]|uniref:uncharacterized protein n=1 Tax=Annulohypoxylon maeteangense TaxID=1927788 RepID=UPI00200752F8|nr:uncharacterized protein GGS22DRAFT_173605 [Annulohypoxylon maeteangense]KAI0880852.1 hypothetical protein GGS22DRAFT_173605 [Annulohypoxylon maeteangense]
MFSSVMTTLACALILIPMVWMPDEDLGNSLALLPPLYIRTEISTGYSEWRALLRHPSCLVIFAARSVVRLPTSYLPST